MYTIQLHKCTTKQSVALRGLRESTKYALYNVRFIYPELSFCLHVCIYFFADQFSIVTSIMNECNMGFFSWK